MAVEAEATGAAGAATGDRRSALDGGGGGGGGGGDVLVLVGGGARGPVVIGHAGVGEAARLWEANGVDPEPQNPEPCGLRARVLG